MLSRKSNVVFPSKASHSERSILESMTAITWRVSTVRHYHHDFIQPSVKPCEGSINVPLSTGERFEAQEPWVSVQGLIQRACAGPCTSLSSM